MTTHIEQREDVRNVRVDHLLGVYAVGSGDWPWTVEYQELIDRPETQELLASVQTEGIHEPILLGTDGRVWDGHHRVVVAMHLGLDAVPVEWAGAERTEPPVTDAEVEAAARAGHEYLRSQRPSDHGPYASWEELDEDYREYLRGIQRAALEAARTTREGKNRG